MKTELYDDGKGWFCRIFVADTIDDEKALHNIRVITQQGNDAEVVIGGKHYGVKVTSWVVERTSLRNRLGLGIPLTKQIQLDFRLIR